MKKINEELKRKYLEREAARGFTGNSWEKYLLGKAAWIVELEDGTLFCIEKPSIETRFCFGESGYDMDEAFEKAKRARTSEDWFRAENLKGLDGKIRLLGEKTREVYGVNVPYRVYETLYISHGDVVDNFYTDRYWGVSEETHKKISMEDRGRILEGYKLVREDFAKRIDRYLKRYGLSKVYSWTYWRDA